MGFDYPKHLWLLTLIAPVVLFYFLKLRRQRTVVPSLLLWSRVLNDQRVNSPFQKFKRHLLLLLQILILAALVLAASAPFIMGGASSAKRIPIIIDNSASMAALAPGGGPSRLERAKKMVRKMINEKRAGTEFALISFADTARSECGFTNNANVILDALDHIKTKDVPSNIEDAMRIAMAMARDHHFEEAELFSDGNFPASAHVGLSFKLNYHKITDKTTNLGITALVAKCSDNNEWTVFVEIGGTKSDLNAMLVLKRNGKKIGEEPCSTGPDASARVEFQTPGKESSVLEVDLLPSGEDALASDNMAYLTLPVARPLNVAIDSELRPVYLAVRGVDGVVLLPWKKGDPPPAAADLIMASSQVPQNSAKVVVYFGTVPEQLRGVLEIAPRNETVVDWRRDAPLLRHANLAEVSCLDGGKFLHGASEHELDNLGYETLVYGEDGPLMLMKNDAGNIEYDFLLRLGRSTLTYRIAFPIMMKNICEIARIKAGLASAAADKTGVLPDIRLASAEKCQIVAPDGTSSAERSARNGLLVGVPAPLAGEYVVAARGKTVAKIGVALLNPRETSLAGIDKISFNEVKVTAGSPSASVPKTLWKYLAIAALIILFWEWWIFNQANRGSRLEQK